MLFIWNYVKKYKAEAITGPVFKFLEATFELIVPFVVAHIIDVSLPQNDTASIHKSIFLLLVFAVVGYICALFAQYFASYVAGNVSCNIRRDLFSKILKYDLSTFETTGKSYILTSLTDDINQISSGINLFLRLFLRSPFIVFGALLMALLIDFKLGLILVLVVFLLFIIVIINIRVTVPIYAKSRKQLSYLTKIADNGISGIRTIRGFNKEKSGELLFEKENKKLYKLQFLSDKISSFLNPITLVVVNLGICLLIYKGAIKVDNNLLTCGELIALYNYISQILIELIKLVNLVMNLNRSLACVSKVSELMTVETGENVNHKCENECCDDFNVKDITLEFKNVSFKFPQNDDYALENINFKFHTGQRIGIIGATGSGKSTIAELIKGLFAYYEGDILLNGINYNRISDNKKSQLVGLVFQKVPLLIGSLRENITLFNKDISDEQLELAIKNSCFEDVLESKKEGLDFIVDAKGTGLSGGQKQRLGIARVLAYNFPIMIFDDSTSALDMNTEKQLLLNTKNVLTDKLVIIIAQKVRAMMDCSVILFVDDGKIVAKGTHKELCQNFPKYREICELQNIDVKL